MTRNAGGKLKKQHRGTGTLFNVATGNWHTTLILEEGRTIRLWDWARAHAQTLLSEPESMTACDGGAVLKSACDVFQSRTWPTNVPYEIKRTWI